jgi:hypothetical protein
MPSSLIGKNVISELLQQTKPDRARRRRLLERYGRLAEESERNWCLRMSDFRQLRILYLFRNLLRQGIYLIQGFHLLSGQMHLP